MLACKVRKWGNSLGLIIPRKVAEELRIKAHGEQILMNCLDSSILVEIAKANPKFLPYGKEPFILSDLLLVEFCGIILKQFDEKTADHWFFKLQVCSFPLTQEDLYEAIKFRYQSKHKKLSFFDAAAYVFSQKHRCTLITSDTDFLTFPGVEIIG